MYRKLTLIVILLYSAWPSEVNSGRSPRGIRVVDDSMVAMLSSVSG